jgi:chemotaxis protein MotB
MSSDDSDNQIIVRRRRDVGDDDYHGGVWKLAFADFMTAMMAFFLVMWLINSTTKENRAAIVQYFNPVHLIDSNPAHKGLRDPSDVRLSDSLQRVKGNKSECELSAGDLRMKAIERELREAPLKALETIARSDERKAGANIDSAAIAWSSRSFGDPFDRNNQMTYLRPNEGNKDNLGKSFSTAANERATASLSERADPLDRIAEKDGRADPGSLSSAEFAALATALGNIMRSETRGAPHIETTQTDEGVLISLIDDANFSMFAIGSIEPRPQVVRVLEKIGRLLGNQKGDIEIRGHTDARSYKSQSYDNWRLSTDRANIAQYMLLRGGLAHERIAKISGFADRRPKNPKDPFAAANRRIEILLRRQD